MSDDGAANSVPLYSIPHFSLTTTTLPVNSLRNGLGFTGTVYTATATVKCSVRNRRMTAVGVELQRSALTAAIFGERASSPPLQLRARLTASLQVDR